MLTPKREKEIREILDAHGGLIYPLCLDLLAEIDRLRDELTKAHQEIANYDGERNSLKQEVERLNQYWKIHDARWKEMEQENSRLRAALERIALLRSTLVSLKSTLVAAPNIAREALEAGPCALCRNQRELLAEIDRLRAVINHNLKEQLSALAKIRGDKAPK